MNTKPFWFEERDLPSFPSLESGLEVDVLIVGGGIAGELLDAEELQFLLMVAGLLEHARDHEAKAAAGQCSRRRGRSLRQGGRDRKRTAAW
jgi:hypothetical protein